MREEVKNNVRFISLAWFVLHNFSGIFSTSNIKMHFLKENKKSDSEWDEDVVSSLKWVLDCVLSYTYTAYFYRNCTEAKWVTLDYNWYNWGHSVAHGEGRDVKKQEHSPLPSKTYTHSFIHPIPTPSNFLSAQYLLTHFLLNLCSLQKPALLLVLTPLYWALPTISSVPWCAKLLAIPATRFTTSCCPMNRH